MAITGTISYPKYYGAIKNNLIYGKTRSNLIYGNVSFPNYYVIDSSVAPPASYCAEAIALFARMDEQPTTALKDLINTTIVGLIADGVWNLADCLYVRGVHTSQAACLNWIKDAHNSTLVNSPVFTPKVGLAGNGYSSYINNNYKPFTDAVNYALNNASISFMSNLLGTTTARMILGTSTTVGGNKLIWVYYYTTGNDRIYLNSSSLYNGLNNIDVNDYMTYCLKNGDSTVFKNGVAGVSVTGVGAAVALPPDSILELAYSSGPNAYGFYNGSIAYSLYSAWLSDLHSIAAYNRIKYFYDNVGGTF